MFGTVSRCVRALASVGAAIVSVLFLSGCSETPSGQMGVNNVGEDPPGRLVVIGGALQADNEPVYRAILDGRDGDGPLCVIPVASGVAEESMASAVDAIDRWGGAGTALGVAITIDNPESANDPTVAQRLTTCSGYYFTGGQQSRVIEVFLPDGAATQAYDAIMERYRAGAVVSGSSAGAAMMSQPMIGGGTSLDALTVGVRTSGEGDGVWVTQGMGFTEEFITDQHFLARGRWGRLLTAVTSSAGLPLGIGVDENTAFVFEDGEGWIVGESGAIVIDARDPAAGVQGFLVGTGDRYRLSDGAVAADAGKMALAVSDSSLTVPDDPFESWTFLLFLEEFGATSEESATLRSEAGPITLTKADGFRAVSFEDSGPQGTARGLSVGPFLISRD